MKRNLLGHCQEGTSDKVYMVSIRNLPDGTYQVWAKWGRRGRNLSEQPRLTCNDEATAIACQQREFKKRLEKRKEAYVDIDSPEYKGPLTWTNEPTIVTALEHDPAPSGMQGVVRHPCSECGALVCFEEDAMCAECTAKKMEALGKAKDFVVICENNGGMEDSFDEGVEYVATYHERDDMYWVFDKFGEKRECFRERFSEPVGV